MAIAEKTSDPRTPRRRERAAAQGVLTIADQAIVSLTGFLCTVIVGGVSKEQLGSYTLGVGTFWLIAGAVNALVWMPYVARAPGMRRGERRRFLATSSATALLCGLVIAGGFVLSGAVGLAVNSGGWFSPFCFALAPLGLTLTLREHVRRVCVADFRGIDLIVFDLPVCVASIAALVALDHYGRLTAEGAFLITAFAYAPSLAIAVSHLRRGRLTMPRLRADFLLNWKFGGWLLLAAIAALVGDSSLRWLLSAVHGRDAMGEFGAVAAFVLLFNPLMLAMASFLRSLGTRVFNSGGYAGLLAHTARATAIAVLLGVLGVAALTVACEWAIGMLFGAEYANRLLVLLMAISLCLRAVNIPADAALTAMQLGKRMSMVAGVRLAAALVVGCPAVYLLGPIGIAIGLIVANGLVLGLTWAVLLMAAPERVSRPVASMVGA